MVEDVVKKIVNPIEFDEILDRWAGKQLAGMPIDGFFLSELIRDNKIKRYDVIGYDYEKGKKFFYVKYWPFDPDEDGYGEEIYDKDEIEQFEKKNFIYTKEERFLLIRNNNQEHNNIASQQKITELEAKIILLQKENNALKARITELESKKPCEIPGLLKYFLSKRKEGMTDKEITQKLRKIDIPRNAIGAVLYPDNDPIKDYGQWLDRNVLDKK